MQVDNIEQLFPTINDYPEQMFDLGMPRGYRVGCGSAYLKSNAITKRFFAKRIQKAFELLPQRDYDSVLDLGTGSGFYLPLLSTVGNQVHGVDINPVLGLTYKMILKKGLHNVMLYRADVTRLPFKSDCFDLLFCLSLIEHIQDQEQTLLEFERILRKDAVLILGYPLQNLPQKVFEVLHNTTQHAKFFVRFSLFEAIKKMKESKQFPYHHVSDFSNIRKRAQDVFVLEDCVAIKLLGCCVYEILLLTR